ncbi:5'-methylthioadenosine/adenosylhomocysteine nucleosidase [Cardiobacteriaceae bacterium TAE3-ERU3]|nr:5'-methylthioadenosine/adenosylhomocysteine nucleosidase [Cardiobacteriaceae bacterium TAE3-ERU3]
MKKQTFAVIAAMEQEIKLLQSTLKCTKIHNIAGINIHVGGVGSREVLLMQCGIGKVNAAIGTTLLLDRFGVSAIINTGSAGALADQLNVGDVVIAETLLHHDVDVTAFGYEAGQMAQMPARYTSDTGLVAAAMEAAVSFPSAAINRGLVVSGDQFVHSQTERSNITNIFPDAMAVEMEAAAIAQVCYRFEVPFVVIRAISDKANGEAETSFDQFLATAANHSAQMVQSLLKNIP